MLVADTIQGLDGVADDDIFDQILAAVVTGLQHQAPIPCTCGNHPLGR